MGESAGRLVSLAFMSFGMSGIHGFGGGFANETVTLPSLMTAEGLTA